MANRLRTYLPGLFRSEVEDADAEQHFRMMVRAASQNIYQGLYNSATGLSGPSTVVPRLDVATPDGQSVPQFAGTHPAIVGPLWSMGMKTGALPIKVFRFTEEAKDGPREREEAPNHPAYQLLRRPNPDLTRNLMISGTVVSMFVYKRCGWLKVRKRPLGPAVPDNPVEELWPIPGSVLFPMRTSKRLIAGYEIRIAGEDPISIPPENVIDFRLMPDYLSWADGFTPLSSLAKAVSWSDEAANSMNRLFRTALLSRLWIDLHGQELEDDRREQLRAEVEVAQARPGGVPILESGATLESLSDGPDDKLLYSAFEAAEEAVSYVLGLPKESSDLAFFYGEVIRPITDAMEQEMERSLFTEWPDDVAFPEFQGFEVIEGSPADRAKLGQIQILSAQRTPNEVRRKDNQPPLEGGDVLLAPLNVVVLEQMVKMGNAVPPKAATSGGFGGREGRQAGGGGTSGKAPQLKAAIAQADPAKLRAGISQGRSNWMSARDRMVSGQSTAIERRLRGILRTEATAIRELVVPGGNTPRANEPMVSLDDDAVNSILDDSDSEIAELLQSAMLRTSSDAYDLADFLMSDPIDNADRQPALPPDSLGVTMKNRVAEMTGKYREARADALQKTIRSSETKAAFVSTLRTVWNGQSDHLVNVIAENETKWSFERGAASAWTQFGDVAVVSDPGECETCQRASAGTFGPNEVPTPLHPGCRCAIVPAGLAV